MEETEIKKGGFHYAFLIVASGIAIACVPCAIVLSCAGIFFTPVANYFGVARVEFTLYFSIMCVAMIVMLPIAGKLMSNLNLRAVLSACVAVDGVTYIAMSQFTAVWQFYIAGALLGLATAPLIYLAVPTLINAWCKKKVGFFIGLCMAFTGIGGVIFNPVGTAFIASAPDGWRMGYLVLGVIILVATLPFTLFVIRSNPAEKGLEPYGADECQAQSGKSVVEKGVSATKAMKTPAFFAILAFCLSSPSIRPCTNSLPRTANRLPVPKLPEWLVWSRRLVWPARQSARSCLESSTIRASRAAWRSVSAAA